MPYPVRMEIKDLPLWEGLRAKRLPLCFDLEITARCNNHCRHCYINLPAGDREACGREMSVDEISVIAGQAVRLGALWCLITGGEPLLRPDFPEIFMALKRAGLLVSVFTNATLVTPEHVELFRRYPPRDIEITVYGATQETYERVTRASGSFRAFTNGLKLLQDSGLRVRLKAIVIQSNITEHTAITDFCRARTVDYFRYDPQLHLRFDGDVRSNEEIRAERLTPGQITRLEEGDTQRMNTLRKGCNTLIRREACDPGCDHVFHCGAGCGSFTVGWDGGFRLCSDLWAPGTVFDLRRGTLSEAWNDFVPQVHAMRFAPGEPPSSCRTCRLVNLCMWCPARAHLETGRMEGSTPYFCDVARARAKILECSEEATGRCPPQRGRQLNSY